MSLLASSRLILRHASRNEYQCRLLCSNAPVSAVASRGADTAADQPESAWNPKSIDALFVMQSRRRVYGSPVLALEAVAMSRGVVTVIDRHLAEQKASPRQLRKSARRAEAVRSPESMGEKRLPKRGRHKVEPPMEYGEVGALSYTVIRSPGTLAANTYVMSEARRCLPDFVPRSMLDFGSGTAVSVMAASRVFSGDPFGAISGFAEDKKRAEGQDAELDVAQNGLLETDRPGEGGDDATFIKTALLIDTSKIMQQLALPALRADPHVHEDINIKQSADFRGVAFPPKGYDIVSASYSLSDIVRSTMATPEKDAEGTDPTEPAPRSFSREERVKRAETRLRKTVKSLWAKTAPGGLFVVVEDGTAAGFETVLFARDLVMRLSGGNDKEGESTPAEEDSLAGNEDIPTPENEAAQDPSSTRQAKVVAPCLHSGACPLQGTVNAHRICRFQQRFNRPPFLRNVRPKATGYEDEYFSYIVLQKPGNDQSKAQQPNSDAQGRWGRLIRPPLLKGKHVTIDACTIDGTLERRVVSKRKAAYGEYPRARRSRWGDVWPVKPETKPQPINF